MGRVEPMTPFLAFLVLREYGQSTQPKLTRVPGKWEEPELVAQATDTAGLVIDDKDH